MPLVVAATPIGNVEDASPRLRDALASADVIAAEDTRRLRRLVTALGLSISARVVSHHDHNEQATVDALLDAVRRGETVLLVTDAGTPLVSDPGYRAVSQAVTEGLPVQTLPGPSAVTAALAVCGLPVDRWCFEGFPPRKAGDRRRTFADLGRERRTMVFFEAPHRLHATLTDLADAFGADRPAAVCRELTKTYEEVRQGSLAQLVDWSAGDVRGEITLVVAGAPAQSDVATDEALAGAVAELVAKGLSRRDAAARVAADFGVPRRRVYDLGHR
jgi:16S rRNA (cytidine1402-2'-O)-methyltransferase